MWMVSPGPTAIRGYQIFPLWPGGRTWLWVRTRVGELQVEEVRERAVY